MRPRNYKLAVKEMLLRETNGCCAYCGQPLFVCDACIDHVDPFGADEVGNYKAACRTCNSRKGQKDLEQFRSLLSSYSVANRFPDPLRFTSQQILWLSDAGWLPFKLERFTFWFERVDTDA